MSNTQSHRLTIGTELHEFVRWKENQEYYFTDLGHYHEILEKQLMELEEHIQNGNVDKSMNELVDILFLSYEAIYAHEPKGEDLESVEGRIRERGFDIKSRFDDIIEKYENESTENLPWAERNWGK